MKDFSFEQEMGCSFLSSWLPEQERTGFDFKTAICNLIYEEL